VSHASKLLADEPERDVIESRSAVLFGMQTPSNPSSAIFVKTLGSKMRFLIPFFDKRRDFARHKIHATVFCNARCSSVNSKSITVVIILVKWCV
jgi:hypothetical protein